MESLGCHVHRWFWSLSGSVTSPPPRRSPGDSTALGGFGDLAGATLSRYDALVQEFELILVAAGVILSAAYIVAQARSRGTTDHIGVRLMLGLIPAVIAVSVVLISRYDVVPDDAENPLWLVGVVLVSTALIIGTGYRLARR